MSYISIVIDSIKSLLHSGMSEVGAEKAEWIPAHLTFNGPAKVSEYFDSRIVERPNGRFIGWFRGHEMVGKYLEIPEDYHACMVAIEDKKIIYGPEIEKVRVWDLDAPSLDNAMQFTDIIAVSKILVDD